MTEYCPCMTEYCPCCKKTEVGDKFLCSKCELHREACDTRVYHISKGGLIYHRCPCCQKMMVEDKFQCSECELGKHSRFCKVMESNG